MGFRHYTNEELLRYCQWHPDDAAADQELTRRVVSGGIFVDEDGEHEALHEQVASLEEERAHLQGLVDGSDEECARLRREVFETADALRECEEVCAVLRQKLVDTLM